MSFKGSVNLETGTIAAEQDAFSASSQTFSFSADSRFNAESTISICPGSVSCDVRNLKIIYHYSTTSLYVLSAGLTRNIIFFD